MSDQSGTRFNLIRGLTVSLVVVAGLASILATTGSSDDPTTGAIACAGRHQQVSTGSVVQLDARCSELNSDALADDELVFLWLLRSRPDGSTAELSPSDTFNPSFVADRDGEYQFDLNVRSTSYADFKPSTIRIIATSDNVPPVAHAGESRQVKVGDSVSLDGSLSSDADGDLLTYVWIVDAPVDSGVTLSDESSPVPVVETPAQTQYQLSLQVSDGIEQSAPDRTQLVVTRDDTNACPDADAGPDQRVATGTPVTLDGSASRDADGDSLSYHWRMVSRPSGSSASLDDPEDNLTPRFVPDVDGAYIVKLRVDDAATSAGQVTNCASFQLDVRDTVVVFASSGNSGPVAAAGADQTVAVNDTVTLNGAGSSDADGDTLVYEWRFISLPSASAATLSDATAIDPAFIADVAGSYVLQLTVSDGFASASDTLVVVTEPVVIGLTRPLADAGPDQVVTVGDSVQLDGAGSSDPNNDPLTYEWTWLDWPSAPDVSAPLLNDPTAVDPIFHTAEAGAHVLRLVVSDGAETSLPDTVSIDAQAAGACADPLELATVLPYQPGLGEVATVIQINGDDMTVVASPGIFQNIDAIQAYIPDPINFDQANFIVLDDPSWSEISRSHANPVSDSESLSIVIQNIGTGIYYKLDIGFTGDENLLEVRIDSLAGCRCGNDVTDCP